MSTANFDRAYNRVKGFFEGEISIFIIPDLEKLGQIQSHPCCTVPESLAVFSSLDFLGFLMRPLDEEVSVNFPEVLARQERGDAIEQNDEKSINTLAVEASRTRENLGYIFRTWFARIRDEYKDDLNVDLITILFRHGEAHQFLPKIGEIGKYEERVPVIQVRVDKNNWPISVLNENILRVDFLKFVSDFKAIILEKKDSEALEITGESFEAIVLRINARLDARLYLDRRQLFEILADFAPQLMPFCDRIYTPGNYQHVSYDVDPRLTTATGIVHRTD